MINMQEAANRVINSGDSDDQEVFISVATVSIICAILSAVFNGIRLYCQIKQNENEGEVVQRYCSQNSPIAHYRVRSVAQRVMGRNAYRKHGRHVVNAIISAGSNSTSEEIQHLIDESSNTYTNRFGETEQEL